MSEPMVTVTGDTYPVRQRLRELGGIWDAGRKAWRVPAEKARDAQVAVENPHIYGDDASVNERIDRP